jgi:hypothetical protein
MVYQSKDFDIPFFFITDSKAWLSMMGGGKKTANQVYRFKGVSG